MDLLTLRAAAGGGSIDGHDAASLAAAGFTLLQRSAPLVRALAGRRAAILLPTSSQFLVALAASDGRGAVLVNPLAAPAEIAYQLADANVGAVFTIASLAERLPPGTVHALLDDAPATAVVVHHDGAARQRVDLGSHFGLDMEGDADTPGRDEECAVVYTSAMAGRPLGAILTHRNLLANARQTVEAAANTKDDHVLAVLPFAHLFGLTVSCMAPLLAGARVSTMARFNPLATLDAIERLDITEIVGVPSIFAGMLAALERRTESSDAGDASARAMRLNAPTLRLCICGGAPLAIELQERWFEATGVELRQGYGLTETSPVALFNNVAQSNHRGTLGVPFPGVEVSILDFITGRPVPPGAVGEICIRSETVFRGYVNGGEHGLRVTDGWLHTGDRGAHDAEGRVVFHGVDKVMFTRNGFNIYPREIERAIAAMPGVRTVTVSATPDNVREHGIHARVAMEPRETDHESSAAPRPTPDDVTAWCKQHLSAYKIPTTIEIVG